MFALKLVWQNILSNKKNTIKILKFEMIAYKIILQFVIVIDALLKDLSYFHTSFMI